MLPGFFLPKVGAILNKILSDIKSLPDDFHEAGVMQDSVLDKIYEICSNRNITHSAETGSGKTSLLMSWLSDEHKIFSLEKYGDLPCKSYQNVIHSPLLRKENVTFVLGPTQKTLPSYEFAQALDFVLLDGPHGFPFPCLEYYYFYRHINESGILAVDDVQIPSVRMLSDFLHKEDMFEFVDRVDDTEFFQRTDAPDFNPYGDDWWLQGYNQTATIRGKISGFLKRIF